MKNLILLILLSQSIVLMAQSETNEDPTYKRSYYAYYGLGYGGQKYANNLGVTVQISDHSTVGLAGQGTFKDSDFGYYGIDYSGVQQTISGSVSVLYGRIKKLPWGHLSLQAGPSFVQSTVYEKLSNLGDYTGEDHEGYGVLIQAGILPAYKLVGFGATAFVNINSVFTHAGITFNLALGRINYKK